MKPTRRPANPCFSSGPCAKRPGWSPEVLNGALLGRSHRSRPGLARLVEVIERSRAILQMPADYRLGIVPGLRYRRGRDGAVVAARRARRRSAVLGEFRRGLGRRRDETAQAAGCAAVCTRLTASLPDLAAVDPDRDTVFVWNGTTAGVRVPNGDWIAVRPQGADDLRRDLGRVRDAAAVGQARCRHLVVAEGAGRRGGARHAGAVAARRRAAGKLHAALAVAENLPHDLGRQADRGDFPRRDDQHAVDAVRRGRDRLARNGPRRSAASTGSSRAPRAISRRSPPGSSARRGCASWQRTRRPGPARRSSSKSPTRGSVRCRPTTASRPCGR